MLTVFLKMLKPFQNHRQQSLFSKKRINFFLSHGLIFLTIPTSALWTNRPPADYPSWSSRFALKGRE